MSLDNNGSTPSTPSSPGDPYEIEPIVKQDIEDVLVFLRTFFIQDEPLNYSLDLLDNKPRCEELEEYCVKDILKGDQISLKAVCNGKIIGVCINGFLEKGYIKHLEEANCVNKKLEKIYRMLDYVAVQSDIFGQFPQIDKAITVKILSVDSTLRGRGIAKELMNKTRDLARAQGCGMMTADCSSHFTARALKKLGFECIYSLKYEDYKVDGQVVFTPEIPHNAITVYAQLI